MYLEFNFTVIICHRYETVINVKLSYSIIIYRHVNCIKKITEQVRYSIATHVRCPLPSINANFRQVIFACNAFLLVKQMSSFLVYIIILHIHLYYEKYHVLKDQFIHVSQIACMPVLYTHTLYYITAVRVIVIDILYYIAFWLILLVHVHRVTYIHVNEDLLYLEPWFAHYQMTSITKKNIYVSICMLLYISSWQYMSHISIILNLDIFSNNIILNKMYSTCVIMMTIAPGNKYTLNKSLIQLVDIKYLETFLKQIFFSFFEFYLSLGYCCGSALIKETLSIVLCGNILMSLFIYIILILSSRKVRHLLVVYNDLKVNNIKLSALEYSLTLLWYKSIYNYSYKSIFTYIRLYTVDPSINICDNISDCTYQKSEVCMSILILVYTLLQLHVNLYVTLILLMFNKFIIMISNKITIVKSCMNISDDIASHNMHKCYVNYVFKYICTCYFCYRLSLMIILSMLTGTVT